MAPLDRLRRAELARDPVEQFRRWHAARAEHAEEPDGMALATATGDGAPSVRMVLVKRFDAEGFEFFTNFGSRKGRDLQENPRAALLLYDERNGRQARVEGTVERVSDEEADAYWLRRAGPSRVSAYVSEQSRPVANWETMDAAWREAAARYPGAEVPRPPYWGGFRLRPERFEFWQHHENRLHDRFEYERNADTREWRIVRLWP